MRQENNYHWWLFLEPERRQAIIWTNAEKLLIGPLESNFIEILIEIHTFLLRKMHFKISSRKWRPFCLGPNVSASMCLNDKISEMQLAADEPVGIIRLSYLNYEVKDGIVWS